ncbi:MAG: aminoglycoside phosphotransferase family protein [Gemmataceae bacterium]
MDAAADIAAGLLGEPVAEITRIGGGRNSQVYRVEAAAGGRVVLKRYFQDGRDARDRRLTESVALRFLRENDVPCVPRLLCTDAEKQASLLEFVEGGPVAADTATPTDIAALAAFLVSLHRLTGKPGAALLPRASEAVFTLAELLDSIEKRLGRLRQVERRTARQKELAGFLETEFTPALAGAGDWARDRLRGCGRAVDEPLPLEACTLSPSDFGLHNTLRQADGRLVFLDFEYFGRDDPAKTVADFLLHPGMALSLEQRGGFLRDLLGSLPRGHALEERVRVAYVVYGLKWVMILLNEFVPEHLARRLFANPALRAEEVQGAQMTKARRMLEQSIEAQSLFPYEEWLKNSR